MSLAPTSLAIVIPCYKVRDHIGAVLDGLAEFGAAIYVVDDACPEGTGAFVEGTCPGIHVLRHATNRGVGAAMLTGYRAALAHGHTTLVKMDGDGQMDPAWLETLLAPLRQGRADYAKGNRLSSLASLRRMPPSRLVANAALTLLMKPTGACWALSDPANGYTAITRHALLRALDGFTPDDGFFFECSLVARLVALGARVADVPIPARYGTERSNQRPARNLLLFPARCATLLAARPGGWLAAAATASLTLGRPLPALLLLLAAYGTDRLRRPPVWRPENPA